MNIQHWSRSDSWATPVDILEKARVVLGCIGLDPASSREANTRVGADYYYTRQEDGLSLDWVPHQSVFLNPPGGKLGAKSKTQLFWTKLIQYRELGHLEHAIFMAFSAEALQTTQKPGQLSAFDFPTCIPRSRIRFDEWNGVRYITGKAPSHSNAIVYIPGTRDETKNFIKVFTTLGVCR